MRKLSGHFGGATASKLLPPVAQVVLIAIVGHRAGVESVGKLALASSMAFLCGSLGEAGFATSFSVPRAYFGERIAPVRATRLLRVGAASCGSALYLLLWGIGVGQHSAVLLVALPLPGLLALGYGYAGALNAARRMHLEGAISIGETAFIVVAAATLAFIIDPVAACLLALVVGRGVGTLVRSTFAAPGRERSAISATFRVQFPFLGTSAAIVAQGQVDVLVIGAIGSFAFLGTYGPLLRCVYGVMLVAEAISWALMSLPIEEWHGRRGLARSWEAIAVVTGILLAAAVVGLANPVLHVLLDSSADVSLLSLALLAAVIPVRFFAFTRSVRLVREGAQARRIPWLITSAIVLALASGFGARGGSFVILAAGRLCAEGLLAAGYGFATRRTAFSPVQAELGRA